MTDQDVSISLELTRAEAIVLENLLFRENNAKDPGIRFEDQAEQRVLWDIHAQLEKNLPELFAPEYLDSLRLAREQVRDSQ